MALRAMVNPGDEVLIPQPSYVSYEPCCRACRRAKPVIIPLKAENEFRLTAQELLDAITEKTKILILPYPEQSDRCDHGTGRSGSDRKDRGRKRSVCDIG